MRVNTLYTLQFVNYSPNAPSLNARTARSPYLNSIQITGSLMVRWDQNRSFWQHSSKVTLVQTERWPNRKATNCQWVVDLWCRRAVFLPKVLDVFLWYVIYGGWKCAAAEQGPEAHLKLYTKSRFWFINHTPKKGFRHGHHSPSAYTTPCRGEVKRWIL